MSDAPAPEGAQTAEAGLPAEGATAPEATPVEPAPEPEYLDIDDSIGSKHVRVKVDGEEIAVPLKEALQGYQRQEAFTRRTQELAEQRKQAEAALQLQQAIQANPGLTMQILAQRQGMTVQEFLGLTPQEQAAAAREATAEDEYVDPLERAVQEQSARLRQLEATLAQEAADRELRAVVDGVKREFGAADEDVRAAVAQAYQLGLPFAAIPMVYQSIAFQKMQVQQGTRQDAAQQQQAQDQARQAAAAAASQVVSSGTGAANISTTPASQSNMSLLEAIEAAYEAAESRGR